MLSAKNAFYSLACLLIPLSDSIGPKLDLQKILRSTENDVTLIR